MYTIVMTSDKQLVTTVQSTIYQRDNLVDKIQFLFPLTYGSLNLAECDVKFNYTDQANTVHDLTLKLDDLQYKDKLRYHFVMCGDLTKFAGSIIGHVVFTYTNEDDGTTRILHTGETAITILPTSNIGSEESGSSNDLEQRMDALEAKVDALYLLIEEMMGIKRAYNFDEVNSAMADDTVQTVILESDIECENESGILLDNGVAKTLDLNGHTITGVSNNADAHANAIQVSYGTLTIKGDGYVYGGIGSHSNVAVRSTGANAKVIIYGGSYNTDVDYIGGYSDVIYATSNGYIEIYGGHFDNNSRSEYTGPERYVLNIKNNSGSIITCYGGEYVNQNPADGDDKDTATGATFLAEGYEVIATEEDTNTIYTVVKSE